MPWLIIRRGHLHELVTVDLKVNFELNPPGYILTASAGFQGLDFSPEV